MKTTSPTLILAPMRGITTMHYRRAFIKNFSGLDIDMAPFISTVNSDRINPKLLKDILPEHNSDMPLIPQVIGNNADDFVQMAIAMHDLGYNEINWNLGCPHKPIRKKQRGSGLLPHPDRIEMILDQICERSPCDISVKVRLGVEAPSELYTLIPILNRFPLSEVIVHPRTAVAMYTGVADLDAFETANKALTHVVCYNGDLNNLSFFNQIQERFPSVHRFMLGRGLLANPFLCEMIKSNTQHIERAIERIAGFHQDVANSYESYLDGDRPFLGKMKEFWIYQSMHLSNGRKMFKKLKKTERISTYKDIVAEFLAEAEWLPNQENR